MILSTHLPLCAFYLAFLVCLDCFTFNSSPFVDIECFPFIICLRSSPRHLNAFIIIQLISRPFCFSLYANLQVELLLDSYSQDLSAMASQLNLLDQEVTLPFAHPAPL